MVWVGWEGRISEELEEGKLTHNQNTVYKKIVFSNRKNVKI